MHKVNMNQNKTVSKSAFRPLVYICAPYTGDIEANMNRAKAFAAFAYRNGSIPLTAHLLFPFLDDADAEERQTATFMDIVLMGKCHEVWVLGDAVSEGMQKEIDVAKRRRQPIRYFNSKFEEVESL